MTQRIGGIRRKTRNKFAKNVRKKGKFSLADYLQTFTKGDNVFLVAEPSIHKGFYHGKFHGKAGIIQQKRGNCYEIAINDINKKKTVIVHPVHLKRR